MNSKTKRPASTGTPATTRTVNTPATTRADQEPADDELRFEGAPEDSTGLRVAKLALGAIAPGALTAKTYAKTLFGPSSMSDALEALISSVETVHAGNLGQAEAMLVCQATALNAIFSQLAVRAHGQPRIEHLETFLKLALKAQNQCRMTLETLATIKNPPVVFARQANIAHGPQQVNNGATAAPATHAAKVETVETGLLETSHVERLDTRAQSAAGGADSHLEAVGKVHRPTHR